MDWTRMPFFLAVARTGSLRAASDELKATHATVDRNLRALEEEYGVRLFERSRQGLSLTEAGQMLLPFAEEAEVSLISARRKLQGLDSEPRGLVRLSIPTTFAYIVLPSILAKFERKYADIELQVRVTNQFEDLNRSEADVSVRIARSVDENVVGRKVLQYTGGVFGSRDYIARHWDNAGPQGEGLQWIGWGDNSPLPDWVKAGPFPKARVRYNLKSPNLIMKMVEAGMGMSNLPFFAAQQLKNVVPMPGTALYADRSIWLLLHADLRRTARARAVVDFLFDELRKLESSFVGPL